jgi:hypothetical protein
LPVSTYCKYNHISKIRRLFLASTVGPELWPAVFDSMGRRKLFFKKPAVSLSAISKWNGSDSLTKIFKMRYIIKSRSALWLAQAGSWLGKNAAH